MDPLKPDAPSMPPTWDVLDRYLAREANGQDAERAHAYLARQPEGETILRSIGVCAEAQSIDLNAANLQRLWSVQVARMAKVDGVSQSLLRTGARTSVFPRSRRTVQGAGVIVVLVLCLLAPKILERFTPLAVYAIQQHYATGTAQYGVVRLSDGSRVHLAPQTVLQYTVDRSGVRRVVLQGHAYFSVEDDASRPFLVLAGPSTVRVLGTEFGVEHYADGSDVSVHLVSGKVAVQLANAPVVLTPGSSATLTDSTILVQPDADIDIATRWARGELAFVRTPVPVVLKALERWYGYQFRLADSVLATQAVTAEFPTDHPKEGLRLLQGILNATLTLNDRDKTVVIRSSGAGIPQSNEKHLRRVIANPVAEVGK